MADGITQLSEFKLISNIVQIDVVEFLLHFIEIKILIEYSKQQQGQRLNGHCTVLSHGLSISFELSVDHSHSYGLYVNLNPQIMDVTQAPRSVSPRGALG
jgi:uncharacterized membrane protein YqhA